MTHLSFIAHEVKQGNGNGQSIDYASDDILYTYDLVDCIAILIIDKNNSCHMIHSDADHTDGKGAINLIDALKALHLSSKETYQIGLIGGQSNHALAHKANTIKTYLPKATIIFKKAMSDGAYLTGNGDMAYSKRQLAKMLNVDHIEFDKPYAHKPGM